jgi:hypothetical protein
MVIARTDLDVPTFLLIPGTGPRRRAIRGITFADGSARLRHRISTLSRRAAKAVTGVFSTPESGGSAAVRHQPARRPEFLEGAAMGREMFRL